MMVVFIRNLELLIAIMFLKKLRTPMQYFSENIANLKPYLDFAKSSSRHLTRSVAFSRDFLPASYNKENNTQYKC